MMRRDSKNLYSILAPLKSSYLANLEEILLNFFSFSILAPLKSSKLEEVPQDFENEKGGNADLRIR